MTVTVSKITIDAGAGEVLELSVADALSLHTQLVALFDQPALKPGPGVGAIATSLPATEPIVEISGP